MGLEKISAAFQNAHATQSAAFMPYFTLGYPNQAESVEAVKAIAPHSDLIELGVPFSDPIADGPTVQRTTQLSLEAGTTVEKCLDMVQNLRKAEISTPFVLMGYYNSVLAYGIDEYCRAARDAGADGFIIPDLPPEEAEELERAAADVELAYVHFLAPTSHPKRVEAIAKRANGFIYMVSVAGVTGARSTIRTGLREFVSEVRDQTDVPLAVGFGISNPEQGAEVGGYADGVIVGSAMLNAYDESGTSSAAKFAADMQNGLKL